MIEQLEGELFHKIDLLILDSNQKLNLTNLQHFKCNRKIIFRQKFKANKKIIKDGGSTYDFEAYFVWI